jgi:alcohol dehydrogenase
MKALVYDGPGRQEWRDVPDPALSDPEDAIVAVEAVTICGTDLHILKGDVPEVAPGRVLGHEALGTVVEAGASVRDLRVGDRVLVSCISACGRCPACRSGRFGQCRGGGGWILGHLVDGTQAEYVRTPFADHSLHKLPAGLPDDTALLLADIVPTAYEVGVLAGAVRPGHLVVVVGAGPIGLAAVRTARLFSPSRIVVVDPDPSRRQRALDIGADAAVAPGDEVVAMVHQGHHDDGADLAIEAVGVPETFELCTELVRPGGRVANIGVHGAPATLHLERLWIRDVTISTGLVDTSSTPLLIRLVHEGLLELPGFITHRFPLGAMEDAYRVFGQPSTTDALKVALHREDVPA